MQVKSKDRPVVDDSPNRYGGRPLIHGHNRCKHGPFTSSQLDLNYAGLAHLVRDLLYLSRSYFWFRLAPLLVAYHGAFHSFYSKMRRYKQPFTGRLPTTWE